MRRSIPRLHGRRALASIPSRATPATASRFQTQPPSQGYRSQSYARRTSSSPVGIGANRNGTDPAFVAAASASAFLIGSLVVANGGVADAEAEGKDAPFEEEKKREDKYGIEYVGFDTYSGGAGVASDRFKAASHKAVSRAFASAGLAAAAEDDITLRPDHAHREGVGTCPSYGCPLLPMDVQYEVQAKSQLVNMRKRPTSRREYPLKSSGTGDAATMTLVGFKGGKMKEQVNQDRALALVPFLYRKITPSRGAWPLAKLWSSGPKQEKGESSSKGQPAARLIGTFDGHDTFGEMVSEHVVRTLPALLGSKLAELDAGDVPNQRQRDRDVVKILHDTFLELDATAPADPSGGCTASAVLQLGDKIYVANAGDSQAFIAVHVVGGEEASDIVYGTREDKAHHKTERDRVLKMGGVIGELNEGDGYERILYEDPETGFTGGLAISRSIGDWNAGRAGVVPDPIVDVLDVGEIRRRVLERMDDPALSEKDVKIFAISASDGLWDYVPEQAVADHVARGLYGGGGDFNRASHPLLACEDLIFAAARGWQQSGGGRYSGMGYRDDITIAVADLGSD